MAVTYDNKEAKPEMTHFSVSHSCTIGGTNYRPSICYPIPNSLAKAIAEMATKGLAKMYPNEVRFVSGTARPMKG